MVLSWGDATRGPTKSWASKWTSVSNASRRVRRYQVELGALERCGEAGAGLGLAVETVHQQAGRALVDAPERAEQSRRAGVHKCANEADQFIAAADAIEPALAGAEHHQVTA